MGILVTWAEQLLFYPSSSKSSNNTGLDSFSKQTDSLVSVVNLINVM